MRLLIVKSLEMVNFKEAFKNNMDVYNHSTNSIIISLSIQDIEPIDQYLNLELFYQLAIKLKHINEENTQVEETVYVQKPGLKQKLLSLFK